MCLISYFIEKQTRSFRKGKRCVSVNFFFISVHKEKKVKKVFFISVRKKKKGGKKDIVTHQDANSRSFGIPGERLLDCATKASDDVMVKHIH